MYDYPTILRQLTEAGVIFRSCYRDRYAAIFGAKTDSLSLSENQVIDAICKTDSEFTFPEFHFRRVAFVRQMRHPCLDVREGDRFNRLPQGHVRLYDRFAVRHIKRMAQQKVRIEHHL